LIYYANISDYIDNGASVKQIFVNYEIFQLKDGSYDGNDLG
jgi:hypothetical protein